ncbi:hypothetical protein DYB26_010638, partial [Aphanomyces astaci]
ISGYRVDMLTGTTTHTHDAILTFVAIDKNGRPRSGLPKLVSPLNPTFVPFMYVVRTMYSLPIYTTDMFVICWQRANKAAQRKELGARWRKIQEEVDAMEYIRKDMLDVNPLNASRTTFVPVKATLVQVQNLFLPKHLNMNNTIFGGEILQWMEQVAVKNVQVGTPLFLLNMSDRHVLGMFEATSSVGMNIIPNAFTAGMPPGTTATPFPVQVRFRFVFDAPPMLNDLLKSVPGLERGVRIGPLTLEATQTLANVFAERCKATNLNQDGAKVEKKANEEQFIVGIEEDKEFGVVQKILGPQGGSHVKRIILDAGGNAKVRLRGRGSGFIEANGEEAKDPLMLVVSADNDRSFRIACDASRDLLGSVHRDYQAYLHSKHRGGFPPMMGGRGMRGPPPPFRGPRGPPPGGNYRGPPPPHRR